MVRGLSNAAIARSLVIGETTARTHVTRILTAARVIMRASAGARGSTLSGVNSVRGRATVTYGRAHPGHGGLRCLRTFGRAAGAVWRTSTSPGRTGARVYDCFLDGKDNFAADREFVRQALEIAPKAGMSAKNNRAFLSRVVRYLVADVGLTQLLDIGSGLPTQGNVSEIAHDIDPTVHVVHVDNDPIVYTHSKALLTDSWTTDIVVRRRPQARRDPGRPRRAQADRLREAHRPAAVRDPAPRHGRR